MKEVGGGLGLAGRCRSGFVEGVEGGRGGLCLLRACNARAARMRAVKASEDGPIMVVLRARCLECPFFFRQTGNGEQEQSCCHGCIQYRPLGFFEITNMQR